tara:strand:- start:36 stop:2879 length:2844 start_codon:yes stop_codon:yes gene_type:complete
MVNILGKGAEILNKLDLAQQKIHKETRPDNDVTVLPGGDLAVKGMDDEGVKALNKILSEEGYKGPGLNLKRINLLFKPGDDGTEVFDLETMLVNIKSNNKELFAFLRRPKQTMDGMVALAEQTGFSEIVYKFLNRKPGNIMPAEETIGGLIAMLKIGQDLNKKALAITKSSDEGEKLQTFRELKILATIQTNLSAQVSGNVSEYGRGLAVVSNIAKLNNINLSEYTNSITDFVENMDEGMIDYHAHAFLNLPNPGKANYTVKGFVARGYDIAMEIYINALLSSPVTHMVNMAGNAIFQGSSMLESGMAGLIGEVRTLGGRRGKIGDRAYMGEMSAEAYGAKMALGDAFKSSALSLSVTGSAGDFVSKIDLKRPKSIGSTDNLAHIMEMGAKGDFGAMLINMIGVTTRLPGRFLASEDEFFKVISKRKVLYREAYRSQMITYETALKGGVPKDQAKIMAQKKYTDIMINPPEDIVEKMTTEAKIMTFQDDPQGAWATLVNVANLPGMKTIVPFSKTPTNIIQQVFDRTFNYSPIYKALKQNMPNNKQGIDQGGSKQSGQEFDKAMSKLVMGNGLFMGMVMIADGFFGDNVVVNGSGPTDWKARRYMRGSNVPPYSIGFKQDNGEYKYITFSRLDPLSGILAMASDFSYYSKNEDDSTIIENLAKAGSLAIAEYAMNLPFLQGVSEIFKAGGNPYGNKDDLFKRMTKTLSGIGGDIAMTVTNEINTYLPEQFELPGASSFTRTLERIGNPMANNTMLTTEQVDDANSFYFPEVMKGFYEALNRAKSGNPKYNNQLEPALDFWGNIKTQGNGKNYEYFSPIKIQSGGYTSLDKELIRLSERGFVFQSHRKKYNGVQLSDKQFNRYVTILNNSNRVNQKYSLTIGDGGYDATRALLPSLNNTISSEAYKLEVDDEEKYNMLNVILGDARSSAMNIMLSTDDRLKILSSENK